MIKMLMTGIREFVTRGVTTAAVDASWVDEEIISE
jgi:hypothetical protein